MFAHSHILARNNVEILDVGSMMSSCLDDYENSKCTEKPLPVSVRDNVAAHFTSQAIYHSVDTKRPFAQFNKRGSCAVVSSAGYLLQFKNGKNIDGADYVLRSGQGPSAGFEQHVGSRTDLRILRYSNFKNEAERNPYNFGDNIVVDFDKVEPFESPFPLKEYKNRDKLLSRTVPYITYHAGLSSKVRSSSLLKCFNSSRDMSSGFRALAMILSELSVCTEVRAYGFLGLEHQDTPYHYWDGSASRTSREQYDSRERRKGGHLFRVEQRCYYTAANYSNIQDDVLTFFP